MGDSTGARATGLGVALLTLVLVVANVAERFHASSWILRDGRFYVNVNEGIVERASLEDVYARSWYTGAHGWNYNLPASFSNIALGRNGEHYSFRPYLLPVLSTPLYFAFGLFGTLMFNVLMFAPIAYGAFRFGRRFARDASSPAIAALFLAFGTGLAFYQYDYHIDVLLIALLISAFGLASNRGSFAVGALFAMCLLIKPTTITILPALCVTLIERRDRKAFLYAILGGAVVIGAGAIMNTAMYGRPWWFGYNRVLIVEAGHPAIADDLDAFTTPFDQGIRELWGGYFGLSTRWTAFLIAAVPGIPYLLVKRPLYTVVAIATAILNVWLFARFEFIGERYLLPTACVLLPFVVATFELARGAVRGLRTITRGRLRGTAGTAVAAGVAAVLIAASTLPFDRIAIDELSHRAPYSLGARALAHGSLDVRTIDPALRTADPLASPVARSRFGDWIARSSPAAVLLATPFVVFGDPGIFVLHFLALFLAVFAGTRLLSRSIHPAIAAAAMAGIALLPVVRDALAPGGTMLLASAAALFAAERALVKSWAPAAVFSVLAAWIADAPWLVALFVIGLAAYDSKKAVIVTLAWTAGTLAVWALVTLVIIGRPFASPEEFVVWTDGGVEQVASIPRAMSLDSFFEATTTSIAQCTFEARDPAARGAILPLLLVAPLGLALAWRRGRLIALVVVLGASFFLFASARTAEAYVALALFAAIPIALFSSNIATFVAAHLDRRRALVAIGVALVLCVTIGGVRRTMASPPPWHLASERAVRDADVRLGDVPCDFLAWEHYAWECATFDGGPNGVTGLNTCTDAAIEGTPRPLFVIPTSDRRRAPRTVRWDDVPSGTLALEYGVPDGARGGAHVVVRSGGQERDAFDVPADASGMIGTRRIEVGGDLEIEVEARAGRATIAFDGVIP